MHETASARPEVQKADLGAEFFGSLETDAGRAGRADIRGVNTLSGYVGTESVSAEFSTTASEP